MKMIRIKLSACLLLCSFCMSGITVVAEECVVPGDVACMTEEIGALYNISPELLQAIAWSESRFCADVENVGCIGIMQINEVCHTERIERLQVENLRDPYGNILVAADYLAELMRRVDNVGRSLMLYHGEANALEKTELSDYAINIIKLSDELLGAKENASQEKVQIYRTTW